MEVIPLTAAPSRRDAAPPDTLTAAIQQLRAASRDRVRQSEIPGFRRRLQELMYNCLIMPLYERADEETDPCRRFLFLALADHVDQYIRMLNTAATTTTPADGSRPSDPARERTRILGVIRQLQRDLGDDDVRAF